MISSKAILSLALLCFLHITVPFSRPAAYGQSPSDESPSGKSSDSSPIASVSPTQTTQVASENGGEAVAGASSEQPQTAPNTPSPSSGLNLASDQSGFFHRFFKAYADDWKPAGTPAPAPAFRGDAAPVNGPPFPFSTWPVGGTVPIGQPWTQAGPLMTALWEGPHGEAWKKSKIQIYGWLNFGGNFSSSKGGVNSSAGKYDNFPTAYDEVPNAIEPDQEVLYIERQPDTVQTDHFDWGFRLSGLWGLDYRFTTSKGFFSQQLLGHPPGKEYGFDPVQLYLDLYLPHIGEGTDVRIGRYISLPDIEAQLAPNNYTYSHSLLYTFDCYTQTGINATTKINSHWTTQVGLSPGCDTAPWNLKDSRLTLNWCVQYSWRTGQDSLYLCDNSTNLGKDSGQYAYNNLQAYYLTWYHKIDQNWHTDTEGWYQWMKQVPNVAYSPPPGSNLPPVDPIQPETNDNGAVCSNPSAFTCYAPEWAIVNYVERQFGPHNYISIRNEYFDDIVGQRTGTKSRYTEHLFGWGHWIGTTVLFRPEVRYEHSYDNPVYQNGTKKSQLTAAGDVIFFF
ncbi:MAG: outer membrane beta-barrel protein [Candidatus Sulfotelmatobacter sp.]